MNLHRTYESGMSTLWVEPVVTNFDPSVLGFFTAGEDGTSDDDDANERVLVRFGLDCVARIRFGHNVCNIDLFSLCHQPPRRQ